MQRIGILGPLFALIVLPGCKDERPPPALTPTPEEPAATPPPPPAPPVMEEKDEPARAEPVEDTHKERHADTAASNEKKAAVASTDEVAPLLEPTAGDDGVEAPTEGAIEGEKKVESNYATWLQGGAYRVGQAGAVTAVLVAKGDFHCNEKYPYKFTVGPAPEGVSFPATVLRGAAIGSERTTLSVPFIASSAGDKTISGVFQFSVCNPSTCKIQKQNLSVTVRVEEA